MRARPRAVQFALWWSAWSIVVAGSLGWMNEGPKLIPAMEYSAVMLAIMAPGAFLGMWGAMWIGATRELSFLGAVTFVLFPFVPMWAPTVIVAAMMGGEPLT